MCVPGCHEAIVQRMRLDRRNLFRRGATVAAAAAATRVWGTLALPARAAGPISFSKVVDLTHALGPDFPTFFGKPQLEIEVLNTYAEHKFNMKKWTIVEHTGTHLDTPFHFSADGASADEIPVEQLVVPLVVVDIAARAEGDADAQLTPDDIKAWEAANGPIPQGACVAMHSGWAAQLMTPKFRNVDAQGTMHFPGFHLEAAQLLMTERQVGGIAVDTLSLDFGKSPDFAVHYAWLPSGRWGIECIAGLDQVPAKGATLVVGGPKIVGATGGPSRVLALV
jgi:kynurenine formamidase